MATTPAKKPAVKKTATKKANPKPAAGGASTLNQDVDAYLAAQSDDVRAALEKLRKDIHAAAPDITEVMSYGVPTFRTNKAVVSFGAAKNHCALYVMNLGVMQELADDLKNYDTSGGTIRFPANKPLPSALVKKIVKARMKMNETRR